MLASTTPRATEDTYAHTLLAALADTADFWLVVIQATRTFLAHITLQEHLVSTVLFSLLATLVIVVWVCWRGCCRSFIRAVTCTTFLPVLAVLMLPAVPQFIANRLCDWGGRKSLRVCPMWRWMSLWPIIPTSIVCNLAIGAGWDVVVVTKTWWTVAVVLVLTIPNFVVDDPAITSRSVRLRSQRGRYAWILLLLGLWFLIVNIPGQVSQQFPRLYHREYFTLVAWYAAPVMAAITTLNVLFFHYTVKPNLTLSDDLTTGQLDAHTTLQYSLTMLVENPVRFVVGFCATIIMVEHDGTSRYASNVYCSRGVHRRILKVRGENNCV